MMIPLFYSYCHFHWRMHIKSNSIFYLLLGMGMKILCHLLVLIFLYYARSKMRKQHTTMNMKKKHTHNVKRAISSRISIKLLSPFRHYVLCCTFCEYLAFDDENIVDFDMHHILHCAHSIFFEFKWKVIFINN